MENRIEFYEFTEEMKDKALEELKSDTIELSPFVYSKFDKLASRMWNDFYKSNSTNFYKDRHYIVKEFPELNSFEILLEVGCGVGNAIFPILDEVPNIFARVCDFSERAVKLLKDHPKYDERRIVADVCDIVKEVPPFVDPCDGVLMLYVLSAIAPENHRQAILNATFTLKQGGILFFRDYARYDLAQLRLAKKRKKKLKANFYLKQDGTRVYYFTTDDLVNIFEGFSVVQNEYHYRLITNRKDEKQMHRVWIQAKLMKL